MVFDGQQQSIRAMVSAEGEEVALGRPVRVVPRVEQWLAELGQEMRATLRRLVVECVGAGGGGSNTVDPKRHPSQVLCLAEEIR